MKNDPNVCVHTIVRNEERWIWFAIQSVLSYVKKVLVYDTGSTDRTISIVKSIKSPKVTLVEKGEVDPQHFSSVRQAMLDQTKSEWIMLLDGDEIWTRMGMEELIFALAKANKEKQLVLIRPWLCMGDVFHYSDDVENTTYPKAPASLSGWMSVRVMRRSIPGLHVVGEYGVEGFQGNDGRSFINYPKNKLIFLKEKYFHMTYLPRSKNRFHDKKVFGRGLKTRFQCGIPFPKDFKYPEIFYKERPINIPDPWKKFTTIDLFQGYLYRLDNLLVRAIP